MSRVRRRVKSTAASPPATPANGDWLRLQSLNLNLGGSSLTGLRAGKFPETNGNGARSLSLNVDRLGLVASPFNCLDSPLHVELAAGGLRRSAHGGREARSCSINLKDGRLTLEIDRKDLAALVKTLVNEALRSEGVSVSAVALEFESLGPRALQIQSRLTAKKRFVSATLEGTGQLVVNDALQARLEDFQLRGEGVIASIVARLLRRQLESLIGQELSLGIGVLGLSLKDIQFAASEKLRIIAGFGSNRNGARQLEQTPSGRQFHVYIIDTGRNKETRRLLDESRAHYAAYLKKHVVYE